MLTKMIFVFSLIAIFVCEFFGIRHYLQKYHKGRLIDAVIEIALLIACIVILSAFAYIYNKFFNIF